jgi:hypothetical protein
MAGFSGQGKIYIGPAMIGAGGIRQPGNLRLIGNATVITPGIEEDIEERNESHTGSRLPFRRLVRGRTGSLSLSFDEFSPDNLALALGGTLTTVAAGGAVTNYAFPSGAKVGDLLAVPAKNISAVAVKDSAGAPATLVLGTDYDLDAFAGGVVLKALGSYVQPFKIDYTPGAHRKVAAINTGSTDYYVRFDGINTDDNSRIVADFFKVRFSVISELPMINEGFADFAMEGDVLADTARSSSGAEGQFFAVSLPS